MIPRKTSIAVAAACALFPLAVLAATAGDDLGWLYPKNDPPTRPDSRPQTVPGSSRTFTTAETRDFFAPPDWRPEGHPAMPDIVARGRRPAVRACSYCHLPNGQGRPENSALAGLPADYIVQQMADFKSDDRKSFRGGGAMNETAKAVQDSEVQAAAQYFSKLTYRRWVKVVETDKAPAVHWEAGLPLPIAGAPDQPIGQRIIEVPVDPRRTTLRDDASSFIAYVPRGSLAAGKTLVETGAGKTLACAGCHGASLKGLGAAPPLAGRSPTELARALYDFKSGARHGSSAELMIPVVQQLSLDDIVHITAYVGSLRP